MNQFDFIVNPKNGKSVSLKSKLGLLVSYSFIIYFQDLNTKS